MIIDPNEFWEGATKLAYGFSAGLGFITLIVFVIVIAAYIENNKK